MDFIVNTNETDACVYRIYIRYIVQLVNFKMGFVCRLHIVCNVGWWDFTPNPIRYKFWAFSFFHLPFEHNNAKPVSPLCFNITRI